MSRFRMAHPEEPYDFEHTKKTWTQEQRDACRVLQSLAGQTDVNVLMKRYDPQIQEQRLTEGLFHFDQADDLKQMLDRVNEADRAFMTLPAEVRKAADNDPVRMLEMVSSDEGIAELAEAGLDVTDEWRQRTAPPPEPEPPAPTQPSPQTAEADRGD